jgi:hypothetical protein
VGGHVARIWEKRNVYRLLVGKAEGKRPLGRPRCGWVDNIKMGLVEIEWDGVNWTGLAQDGYKWSALVNGVMNIRFPWKTGKLSSGFSTGGLSSYLTDGINLQTASTHRSITYCGVQTRC